MSVGVFCIVSDCTSATEIVFDGLNGFGFEAESELSLKEKMIQALNDNTIRIMQDNIMREFELKKYTQSAHVGQLLEIYKDK